MSENDDGIIMMESEEYKNLDEAEEIRLEDSLNPTPCAEPLKSDNPAVVAKAMGIEKPETINVERPPVQDFEKDETEYSKTMVKQVDQKEDVAAVDVAEHVDTELGVFRATVVMECEGEDATQSRIKRTIAADRLKRKHEEKIEIQPGESYITDPDVKQLLPTMPTKKTRTFSIPERKHRRRFGWFRKIAFKIRRARHWWQVRKHVNKAVSVAKINDEDLSVMSRQNEGTGIPMNMVRNPNTGVVFVAHCNAAELKERYPDHEIVESKIRG